MGGRERRQGAEQRRANCPPTRRRTDAAARPSSPAFGGRGDGAGSTWPQRRHRAQLARQGMARRDEAGGRTGAKPDSTHLPAHPVGETHTRTSALGAGRSSCAEPPVGRHEKKTSWAARRPGVDCEPTTEARAMEHKHAQDWNTNEAKADAADDATQLALTGTAGRGARRETHAGELAGATDGAAAELRGA
ncbi:hypothetical protein ERJ75_000700200 [Trypanosoma vivax]|nr:hypothetical protein ERJ75_000700200 [Trypanosoma vivax]